MSFVANLHYHSIKKNICLKNYETIAIFDMDSTQIIRYGKIYHENKKSKIVFYCLVVTKKPNSIGRHGCSMSSWI